MLVIDRKFQFRPGKRIISENLFTGPVPDDLSDQTSKKIRRDQPRSLAQKIFVVFKLAPDLCSRDAQVKFTRSYKNPVRKVYYWLPRWRIVSVKTLGRKIDVCFAKSTTIFLILSLFHFETFCWNQLFWKVIPCSEKIVFEGRIKIFLTLLRIH